ncbi:MAG: hypothetical protein KatS3mg008_1292 [Acidimicrobiales bacterium]|nr:MAG: hypothetical protein KatS3mg008_1292 [Acidimicrobiales bacterium]
MKVVYRSADWDTPWWVQPNRGPGRFHTVNSLPTQYLSDHPLTVFAERLRHLGQAFVADLHTARWRCWAMKIEVTHLEVIDFDNARSFGISPDELVGDDWKPCQDLARRLREEGVPGLVVPSAALPGTRNIVLFGPRVASPFLLGPVDLDIDVPTAHTAEEATPPH